MTQHQSTPLSWHLIFLMAFAIGVTVASNYYAQPLLHSITNDLNIGVDIAGSIIMTAQFCYALGLLFITPLGDKIERKKLIIILMILTTLGLVINSFATHFWMLIIGTAMVGLFSAVVQVLIPFAVSLSKEQYRGRVVGILMSGMLLGILIGRSFAGAISTITDWHYVYLIAASIMIIITGLLWVKLPSDYIHKQINYFKLLISIGTLYRQEPLLRMRCTLGFISFAIFSLLWTPLAFLLSESPYHYSDFIIGLFGLAGAAGAFGAPIVGKLSDKGKGSQTTLLGLLLLGVSWFCLYFAKSSFIALVAGIILLDFAVQIVHIANLNDIYSLKSDARSRLNTAYMVNYFAGGMMGSIASTYLYSHFGWSMIVVFGVLLAILGILVWVLYQKSVIKTKIC